MFLRYVSLSLPESNSDSSLEEIVLQGRYYNPASHSDKPPLNYPVFDSCTGSISFEGREQFNLINLLGGEKLDHRPQDAILVLSKYSLPLGQTYLTKFNAKHPNRPHSLTLTRMEYGAFLRRILFAHGHHTCFPELHTNMPHSLSDHITLFPC